MLYICESIITIYDRNHVNSSLNFVTVFRCTSNNIFIQGTCMLEVCWLNVSNWLIKKILQGKLFCDTFQRKIFPSKLKEYCCMLFYFLYSNKHFSLFSHEDVPEF